MNNPLSDPRLTLLPPGPARAGDERTPDHRVLNRINRNLAFLGRWFLNALLFGLGDIAGLSFSMVLASHIRNQLRGDMPVPPWIGFALLLWMVSALAIRLLPGWGLGPVEELRRTTMLLLGVYGTTAASLFFAKTSTGASRLTLIVALSFSIFLLPLIRTRVKALLIRLDLWGLPAVIYGDAGSATRIVRTLRDESSLGYIPVAVVDDLTGTPPPPGAEVDGLPLITDPRKEGIYADVAVFLQQGRSRHQIVETIEGRLSDFRHIVMIPDIDESPSLWVKPRDMGGVLGLEVTSNLLDLWARSVKRIADMTFCLLTVFIWLPLMAVIATLIWLQDRKSPLFRQERIGQNGRGFKMLKFRTMSVDAEKVLQKKLDEDPLFREQWEQGFKMREDPRITRIGYFLRKTSLDELPQLVNVLRNEMSLVGPRPLPRYHHGMLPGRVCRLRERVKPGMTGMWQVSGRSEAGNEGLVKWDSYYVRNWSVWLDIVIMVRTFRVVLTGRGAF
ncbi:MAG: undecaprenyl-phosphate galactose phosphotransferase WbaP [Kiritimatiellia bacterium]